MIAIPGYTIVDEIGRGGMATVFRARQALLDRDVALKVLSPQLTQSASHAERFLQEARLLAALEHPHVVRVFDVGVSPEGLHYFSMQLLTGGDLGARLREGMSEADLVRVLEAVAEALGFAHERGYVHRDVTPANILFDLHDEPVLTDFGIARVMSAASRLTPTGLSIGTGRYMSPEQAQGMEVDRRSDIYSLGVVTYEAIAGHLPFEGEDAFSIAMAHVTEPVPPLPEECARWQPVIDGALAKDPKQRFADSAAFLQALRRAVPELFPQTVKPTASGRLPARRARADRASPAPPRLLRPAVAGLGAGLVGGLALALAWWLWPKAEEAAIAAPVAAPGLAQPAETPVATSTEAVPEPAAPDGGPVTSPPVADPSATVLEPDSLATVRDPVPILLALADADLAARRLSVPAGTNALERYRLVLRFDPRNQRAREGVVAVGNAYLQLADAIDPARRRDEWLQMLQRAEAIAADPVAASVAAGAAERRRAFAEAAVSRGAAAAERWNREAALAEYGAALQVLPDFAPAREGLQAAELIGRPGFRFSEALEMGGRGPEMVLLGEIAMSRTELTMADFRHYWDKAGHHYFSADPPACRDRERGFLFGAGDRGWRDPEVATGERHPVVCVSYGMLEAYAAWLSAETGARYRPPTAAEWRAARGNGQPTCAAANRRDAAYRARFGGRDGGDCDDGFATTAPVASFAPRRPGLYDLDGNVREWVSDCGPRGCSQRLAMGAAWLSDGSGAEAFDADKGYNSIGVRLVREWTGRTREQEP